MSQAPKRAVRARPTPRTSPPATRRSAARKVRAVEALQEHSLVALHTGQGCPAVPPRTLPRQVGRRTDSLHVAVRVCHPHAVACRVRSTTDRRRHGGRRGERRRRGRRSRTARRRRASGKALATDPVVVRVVIGAESGLAAQDSIDLPVSRTIRTAPSRNSQSYLRRASGTTSSYGMPPRFGGMPQRLLRPLLTLRGVGHRSNDSGRFKHFHRR